MASSGKRAEAGQWPPQEEFADRLARLRRARPLSNAEIAAACDIAPNTVSNWKGGQTPQGMPLIKLARLFNVTPEWLLTGDTAGMEQLPPAERREPAPTQPAAKRRSRVVHPGEPAKRKNPRRAS